MSSDPTYEPYQISVAPEAVEVGEDHLAFPSGVYLPLSARGSGVPGMADRPWSRLTTDIFYTNLPTFYSLALRREPSDVLCGSLRARRTLFEGFVYAPSHWHLRELEAQIKSTHYYLVAKPGMEKRLVQLVAGWEPGRLEWAKIDR